MPTFLKKPFASRTRFTSGLSFLLIYGLLVLSLFAWAGGSLLAQEEPAKPQDPAKKAELVEPKDAPKEAAPEVAPKEPAEPRGNRRRDRQRERDKAAPPKAEEPAPKAVTPPAPATPPAPPATPEKTADKSDTKAEPKAVALKLNDKVDDAAWRKASPESVADLKAIQDRVQELAKAAIPRVVGLRVGNANGSGVIISKEGYVLTAGHVSATPDRPVDIILHNGRVVRGRSLGRNSGIDSGLVKINDGEEWDYAEMGDSEAVKQGDWCVAIGHPGGYMRGRPPVVRLGRVISSTDRVIWTDATLVGGDSGGPLFDMNGKVIAIHSRISAPTSSNFHVPVETYRETWDRLASMEDWSDRQFTISSFAGFNADPDDKGARVTSVVENSPAALAGVQIGDIVIKFDGANVRNLQQVIDAINKKRPNEQVAIELLRDGQTVQVTITLAAGFKAGPFLGITGQTNPKGVGVASIVAGTPADTAKLERDDIITQLDGRPMKDLEALQVAIARKKAGDTVELTVVRGDQTLKLKLILGMRG